MRELPRVHIKGLGPKEGMTVSAPSLQNSLVNSRYRLDRWPDLEGALLIINPSAPGNFAEKCH